MRQCETGVSDGKSGVCQNRGVEIFYCAEVLLFLNLIDATLIQKHPIRRLAIIFVLIHNLYMFTFFYLISILRFTLQSDAQHVAPAASTQSAGI